MPSTLAGAIAAAALALSPASPPTPPSVVLARVAFRSQADLDALAERLDLTAAVDRSRGTVEAVLSAEEYVTLVKEGRGVEVLEEPTRLLNAPRERSGAQRTGISGYACYRTVDETYAAMENLANTYPTLASWEDIGDTWDKVTAGGQSGR